MRLFTGESSEPPAIAGISANALAWQPIETFDHVARPLVFLRSRDRLIAGSWGRPASGDAAPIAPLQWGEIVDGAFLPLPRFRPTEWAPISDTLFEPAAAFPATLVLRAEGTHG